MQGTEVGLPQDYPQHLEETEVEAFVFYEGRTPTRHQRAVWTVCAKSLLPELQPRRRPKPRARLSDRAETCRELYQARPRLRSIVRYRGIIGSPARAPRVWDGQSTSSPLRPRSEAAVLAACSIAA